MRTASARREKNQKQSRSSVSRLKPRFGTLEHFQHWAEQLVLDPDSQRLLSRKHLRLEGFQLDFSADLLSGITEVWDIVPEGNGKTTLFAAHALFHIETRPEAMAPVGAAAREQAEIMYRQGEGFVRRTPGLIRHFECLPGYRMIRSIDGTRRMQVFAADDKTGDGVIPTLAMIDEPHRQKDMGLYRTWRGKLGKRQGQIALISTAGEPGSEFEAARERLRQQLPVLKRTRTYLHARSETVALHEWALPEAGDVEDFELVKRCNPLSTITVASLRQKFESPTTDLLHWRRFVCNLPTRAATAAITEAEWARAKVSDAIPAGTRIWAGLDLGWKWDTTALVPYWQRGPHDALIGRATVLVPPRDHSSLNPNKVELAIKQMHALWPIHTIVMDMTKGEQLAEWAKSELGIEVADYTQGDALAARAYEHFMEWLRNSWLHHTGDPGLTQHTLNAITKLMPSGKSKFERPSRAREGGNQQQRVIDALDAAAMVHAVATANAVTAESVFASAWR